ncbi:RNA recognition motif domain [Macleaya cordata]|uniref:RNA recognition motif domain n=1 Tax=Macleaya cordata TaxID=56857 RepID=A0A200QJ69_MACCD|nr:RNA recognition motif domain [Macleaya cordata]
MMQQPTGVVPPPMAQPAMDQQQQQWMMMQSQQPQAPPMWNQQPPPATQSQTQPQQQPQPQQQSNYPPAQPASADEIRTLWIGDLQYWMEESYLHSCFAHTGEVVSVKVIRNKQTTQSEGYGFIEFMTRAAAERVLQTHNGTLMPNVEQNFRLNWASFGVGERRPDDSADFTIFVGDLASDVTDYMLQETFRSHYPSIKGAKVVTDRTTGRSKGYGFVRFGDESEQIRAMNEMNGMFCSTRPMRIGPATTKKNVGGQQSYPKGCQEALSNRGLELISAEMHSPLLLQFLRLTFTRIQFKLLRGRQDGVLFVVYSDVFFTLEIILLKFQPQQMHMGKRAIRNIRRLRVSAHTD